MPGCGQKGDYAPFMLVTPKSAVYAFFYAGIKARCLPPRTYQAKVIRPRIIVVSSVTLFLFQQNVRDVSRCTTDYQSATEPSS